MKTKLLFSTLVCLTMAFKTFAQTVVCTTPPNCIQNGDLTGPTTSGNMNSTAALTVPNWHVSHGTPTYGPSQVWMWSQGITYGEGMFTCYNFVANRQYRVCFRASYDASSTYTTGVLNVMAANGLLAITPSGSGGPVAAATNSTTIANPNITTVAWTNYAFLFTPNINYSQLWFFPFTAAQFGGQYALTIDNIHVEDLSIPDPAITITPSGPLVNGTPVNLTAAGAPASATYNWLPGGFTGNPLTATPNCEDQIISVTASYNNCTTPGTVICQRTSPPATINIKATEGCCATITTSVYCNGSHAMMDFWITNTSSFNFNAYRLYNCISGTVQDWNNAISIPIGMTGGPYTIDLTALGYPPNVSTCFCLDMIEYVPEELCPKNVCRTDRFCIDIPECKDIDCCNAWGIIAYDDYSNPQFPQSTITKCGEKLSIPCGKVNGFDFFYTCKEGCTPSFKSELYNSSGTLLWSNTSVGTSSWYHIGGLSLTSTDVYTLRVYAYCGGKLCETCELYLDVNCGIIHGKSSGVAPMKHSIIPNPATTMVTILSKTEPILNYSIQSQAGVNLLNRTGINNSEVTVDISSIPNGMYTIIINNKYTYKLIKKD